MVFSSVFASISNKFYSNIEKSYHPTYACMYNRIYTSLEIIFFSFKVYFSYVMLKILDEFGKCIKENWIEAININSGCFGI